MNQKTFKEVSDLWKRDKKQYVKESSYSTYVLLLNKHLLPAFGDSTEVTESEVQAFALRKLDEETLLQVFEGVPQFTISKAELEAGINPLELLAVQTQIFPSKGEARKMIQANGFSMNKEKLTDPNAPITTDALIDGKYIIFQKGKKNYFLVIAE